MQDRVLSTRIYSNLGVELCANTVVDIAGERLTPDDTKAYAEFFIAHAFPVVTAHGTSLHPGTVANSFRSMRHQVFNRAHLMKAYDKSGKGEIPRDHILGSIVAVEFPQTPGGGWRVGSRRDPPAIRAAAVIHKHAEGVPKILGEHLSGRHKWTVSMEVDYNLLQSGFVVGQRDQAKDAEAKLMNATTPVEFNELGMGYVPMEQAPESLLETYDYNKLMMKRNASWEGLPVTMLKGGINGQVHFRGVGLVRYGAEREAVIAQILATDPALMPSLMDAEEELAELRSYFESVVKGAVGSVEALER
ncbi:MAG TPA: hypothetical protein VMU04_10110 [Candidatus Acidoferrum sp.]|nr:hypothetical protein [Candidatus Acidoferrum sp.]